MCDVTGPPKALGGQSCPGVPPLTAALGVPAGRYHATDIPVFPTVIEHIVGTPLFVELKQNLKLAVPNEALCWDLELQRLSSTKVFSQLLKPFELRELVQML